LAVVVSFFFCECREWVVSVIVIIIDDRVWLVTDELVDGVALFAVAIGQLTGAAPVGRLRRSAVVPFRCRPPF